LTSGILRGLSFSIILTVAIFAQNEWQTEFEKSGFVATSTYSQTDEYFSELAKVSKFAQYSTIGVSPQGRDIKLFTVSKDKAFTPADAAKSGKPVLLIINGIHSGEIEGKDASMMFLREMLVEGKHSALLDNVIFLIVPIFSVDGHERASSYNRINQDGPVNMGWRTTARNLNLNRDWTKADAPEMQAMLKMVSKWSPDFIIDNHTTNGADYQYTVTYGLERFGNMAPNIAKLVERSFLPFLIENVESAGWLMSPYVGFKNNRVEEGLLEWASVPRFSNGYMASKNRICLLVETHMMKPYKERVFATKKVIETAANYLVISGKMVIEENRKADNNISQYLGKEGKWLPIKFALKDTALKTYSFKGIEAVVEKSDISGGDKLVYTGKKFEKVIPYFDQVHAVDSVRVPAGYLIPAEYEDIVEKAKLHGIKVEKLDSPRKLKVERFRFHDHKFAPYTFEGRTRVSFGHDSQIEEITVPAGSFFISCNQATLKLIVYLFEPKSDDSYLAWGFFNQIFEQKEYYEDYVMERLAPDILKNDPQLKKDFEEKLATDEKFRNNPDARLNFIYKRSPYFDKNYCVYPILRVLD
jgi:murein tripeptide amidase MpaA